MTSVILWGDRGWGNIIAVFAASISTCTVEPPSIHDPLWMARSVSMVWLSKGAAKDLNSPKKRQRYLFFD